MKLNIQTGVAFRLLAERTALVQAVADAAPDFKNETNWIEWKSTFDLDKPVGAFLIAKAILGFANREPGSAAAACDGTAYMIVGAEPGNVSGVQRVDFAVLHDIVGKYVTGVRWEPHYVEYAGKDVLIVVVEPPRNGDPIHTLQKSYEGYRQGTPFHRGPGKTEPADAADMKMLQNRLLAVKPTLDVKLRMRAKPLVRLVSERQEWLNRRKAHIRSSTERPQDPPPSPQPSGRLLPESFNISAMMGGRYATAEDAKEFESRVRTHLVQARANVLDNVIQRIVRSNRNKIEFDVYNHTDDPIEKVELTVRVPKEGGHVFTGTPSAKAMPQLPSWPKPFEPMDSIRSVMAADNPYNYDIDRGCAVVVEREDIFEVSFDVDDLRAGRQLTTPPMTIIPGPNSPDAFPIEVIAAAMNRRGHKRVDLSVDVVPLDDGAWSLDDWVPPDQ